MANIFRTPLISNPIGRNRFPGLVEVVSSFVLTTLAITSTISPPPKEIVPPPKRPVYVQQDQISAQVTTLLQISAQLSPSYELSQPTRRPLYNQLDHPPNLRTNTQFQVGFPFLSVDLGNPPKRLIAQEPFQVQAPVFTTLLVTSAPRTPLVLNIPKRPTYYQVDPPPTLLNITLITTPPIQYLLTQEKDRQNPPRRPIAQEPYQVQAPVLTTLALVDRTIAPLITPTPKRPTYNQIEEVGTPIELIVSALPPPPFEPPLQENPARKPIYNVSGYFFPGERIAPAIAAPAPFFQNDQPNPNRRDPDLKYQTHTVVSVFGPNPFQQTEFPNPSRRPPYTQVDPTANILILGIPVVKPFRQSEHLNPTRRPIYYQENLFTPFFLGLTLPPAAPPFKQTDHPNPSRRPISYQDLNIPFNGQTLGIPIGPPPFYQTDHPNPSRRPISYQDQNQQIPFTLGIPVGPPPFKQTYHPNAIQGKVRQQPDPVPNLVLSTLIPVNAVLPFANFDWPNPQRLRNIYNSGIFDFGGTAFNLSPLWSIIPTGSGTWTIVAPPVDATWSVVQTGANTWTAVNPQNPIGNSGGVT